MTITQEERDKLYAKVAAEAWQEMNDHYHEFRRAVEPDDDSDCEIYLYVFGDGAWTIDHAQYIPTTNGCVAAVPLAQYNGPAELAEDIELNEDWDAMEEWNAAEKAAKAAAPREG